MGERENRLQTERNVWLATTRPSGKPHLIPIWFVWQHGKFYICTQGDSVKVKNIQREPRVSVSLENGDQPAVAEGLAVIHPAPYPADIVAAFKQKFQWDITTDAGYTALIEITPHKWLRW
jgi:PPOX class probable F420-dependent enzyme